MISFGITAIGEAKKNQTIQTLRLNAFLSPPQIMLILRPAEFFLGKAPRGTILDYCVSGYLVYLLINKHQRP